MKVIKINISNLTIIVSFVAITIGAAAVWLYQGKYANGMLIANEVVRLQKIFERIHATAHIESFDHKKNSINFLNVATFAGSQVGPINLSYPHKWQGPYVQENPTMQDIEYQVVQTKEGYFIAPGDGVTLPNGKVIGKDIVLDENADIKAMVNDRDKLEYIATSLFSSIILPLAVPLDITKKMAKTVPLEEFLQDEDDV
jgi:hypothetical protein